VLRDRIERSIDRAVSLVGDGVRAAARGILRQLPDARRVCHGDFHPDNVILRNGGSVVIDWGPASAGHPAADVAWTVLLFRLAGTPPGTPLRLRVLVAIIRRAALRIYLRAYFRLTGFTWRDVKGWLGVVALLRLSDDIPEERASLLRLIERELPASR
jgi:aminoglycoside phosphotransferase (APT) family kinase protein